MKSHFRVVTRLDRARAQAASVTIDRAAGLCTVRPLRSRRTFTLPLSTVATYIVTSIIRAELALRRRDAVGLRARKRA